MLISRKFYYFGEHAIDLPKDLDPIIIKGHGCKSISDESVNKLKKYIEECGYKKYGIFGKPNKPKNGLIFKKHILHARPYPNTKHSLTSQ